MQVDPIWSSRVNALAMIAYSLGAVAVLVVLAYRDLDGDLHQPAATLARSLLLDNLTEEPAF